MDTAFVTAAPVRRSLRQRARDEHDAVIERAVQLLEARWRNKLTGRETFCSPNAVKDYVRLRISELPHEVFMVMFVDAQNRLITAEEMFRGTLTQASVYPREVVVAALQHGASSVVLAHNHPSGSADPSRADEALTQTLKAALALVDVRVLDHIIVTPLHALSMAERGLL